MSRDRGSMHVMVCASILVLAIFGIGGAALGRIVSAKMDLQRGADAAALGGAEMLRDKGRGQMQGALALGPANDAQGIFAPFDKPIELVDRVVVTSRANQPVDTPSLAFKQGAVNVVAGARAYVLQKRFSTVNPPHARVVLVLDYSGSMGGGRMSMLKQSVNEEALKTPFPIDWAAVLFSSSVLDKSDFQPLDPAKAKKDISDIVNKHDANGGTQTDAGLNQAADYLEGIKTQTSPNERYVLLVSDGGPNDAGAATAAAQKIWHESDATIITLTIGDDPSGVSFMKSVSGKEPKEDDEKWAMQANDPETLRKKFSEIISRIGCPLEALPEKTLDIGTGDACINGSHVGNCLRIGGFLRPKGGGAEQPLAMTTSTDSFDASALNWSFDKPTRTPTLSLAACKAVQNGGQEFVVRYNRARLSE